MLSIVYTVGIVWRVEKELDTSYKFFAFSILFFFIAELSGLYYTEHSFGPIIEKISMASFAFLFLIGTLYMRDIVRKLDGEKPEIKK